MKQKRTIIALVVILLLLGVVSYWDELETATEDKLEAEKNKPIKFSVEDVEEFLFESHDGDVETKVSLVKVKGEWRFKEDLQLKANSSTVNSILKTLQDYKFDRELDPSTIGEYGLERPRRSIAFLTDDDQRFTIDIGDNTPVGYSVYFSVNQDAVYSGPQYLVQSTDRKAIDFRDRKLADFKSEAVESIEYNAGGSRLLALENKGGKFELNVGKSLVADQAVVQDFLDSIRNAEVKEFIDTPDKEFVRKYFSSTDSIRIVLNIQNDNPIEVEIADVDNHFWLRKPDGSFGLLPDHHVRKLVKQVIDFRDRRLINIEASEVNHIKINEYNFERIGGDFYKVASNGEKQEKSGRVYNFLMDLVYGKADDIFSNTMKSVQSLTKGKPEYLVELRTNSGTITMKVWPSRADETSYILQISSNDREVYQIKKKIFASAASNG